MLYLLMKKYKQFSILRILKNKDSAFLFNLKKETIIKSINLFLKFQTIFNRKFESKSSTIKSNIYSNSLLSLLIGSSSERKKYSTQLKNCNSTETLNLIENVVIENNETAEINNINRKQQKFSITNNKQYQLITKEQQKEQFQQQSYSFQGISIRL